MAGMTTGSCYVIVQRGEDHDGYATSYPMLDEHGVFATREAAEAVIEPIVQRRLEEAERNWVANETRRVKMRADRIAVVKRQQLEHDTLTTAGVKPSFRRPANVTSKPVVPLPFNRAKAEAEIRKHLGLDIDDYELHGL